MSEKDIHKEVEAAIRQLKFEKTQVSDGVAKDMPKHLGPSPNCTL